ncbi:AlpA family phage regulatory protein [Desulfovibrio sp. OttesenSCG-928-I05]|nr:AlpA family phage regulatory protein [Desulfovibrio sp. OttesenSCG-928-I05]
MNQKSPLSLPDEGFIRLPQLISVLGIQKSKIWDMIKAEQLPAPKKLGYKTSVWDVREIREVIERISREGSI